MYKGTQPQLPLLRGIHRRLRVFDKQAGALRERACGFGKREDWRNKWPWALRA